MKIDFIDFFGIRISDFTYTELDCYFDEILRGSKSAILYGYSFGIFPYFKVYTDLYSIINSFDVLVTDGTQFKWFYRAFGYKVKTTISIPDLTNYTIWYAQRNNLSLYILGGTQSINNMAIEMLMKKFSNINFIGGRNGYFSEEEEMGIIQSIAKKRPNILLIGISTPIKERIAVKFKDYCEGCIIIPCGGMIDVYAGYTKQTPKLLKDLGLATLYRVIQEPKRLLLTNLWMLYETFLKIIPIAVYNRVLLRKKKFNLIYKYISK